MPTLKEVADKAGVSLKTASLALRGLTGVSSETSRAVLEAADKLQYRSGYPGSHRIGLSVPNYVDPYYAEIASYLKDAAAAIGYDVIHDFHDRDPHRERQLLQALLQAKSRG